MLSFGGALGVNVRYWLGVAVARWAPTRFPWATFGINVSGSFAIGFGAVVLASRLPHPLIRLFAVVGFLGGYTTFSSFSFESFALWEEGQKRLALANAVGSVAAGLVAVVLGVATARALVSPDRRPAGPDHPGARVADSGPGILSDERLEGE